MRMVRTVPMLSASFLLSRPLVWNKERKVLSLLFNYINECLSEITKKFHSETQVEFRDRHND